MGVFFFFVDLFALILMAVLNENALGELVI